MDKMRAQYSSVPHTGGVTGRESTSPDSQNQQSLSWTEHDAFTAAKVALALDLAAPIERTATPFLIQSELCRDTNVAMLRRELPSLLHAWRFCHAAKMLERYEDTTIPAQALRLGCRIANAALPGWSVVNVVFAEVGSLAAYIAKEPTRAIVEADGILRQYIELTDAGRECAALGR